MSKSIHFFATRQDIESILRSVERIERLKFTRCEMSDSPDKVEFASGLCIPNLGSAPSGDHNQEPFWLITSADARVEVEVVPQRRGGTRYGIDPGLNPESIVMWPGGRYESTCLIAGQVGTAMNNAKSAELFGIFAREFRAQFRRIHSYYVGNEAERLLDAGVRLTSSIQAPRETDLSR